MKDHCPQAFSELLAVALRQHTKAAHHQLDHHPMLAPLLQPDLTQEHYERLLKTLYWIHLPLHFALTDCIERVFPESRYRPSARIDWLRADMAYFKIRDIRLDMVFGNLEFKFSSPAAVVGALYTVEGSTMGGQVIARQLKSSLGIDADTGANFFHGHGGDTHARWSEFWQFAGEAIAEDGIEEVCNSASEIFVRFKRSLTWADGYWTFIDHLSRQAKDVPRTSKVYFDRDH